MRIGLVCPYSIHKHGGVLEVVLALRDGLKARGHYVKIITPEPRGTNIEAPPGVIYLGISTDFRAVSQTTTQVSSAADNDHIDAVLAEQKFDILHFHEPWSPLLSRQLLQRSDSVNIATFHSKVPEAFMTRTVIRAVTPYLKSVMKYLHVLTAVSDSGAEYAASLTDEPIAIIPNGIDLKRYHKAKEPLPADHPKTILYVGRLEGRKGVRYLLKAYQLIVQENSDVRLLIAGDGSDREKLELLADDLKLPNVSFLGYVDTDLKLQLMQQADIFCSPAVFGESFGIVLLEAMATGAVSIAGNNSGYSDLMQGVGAISIVNPHDSEEFARRMHLLLNEPKIRQLWQEWADEYVQQFSYDNVVKQYEELYEESLAQYGHKH